MTNAEKASLYDALTRKGEELMRENANINSRYFGNIPDAEKKKIEENLKEIATLENKIKNMMY